jgi:CheY-like chemotaxis protein
MSSALVIDDHRDTANALCQMLDVLGLAAQPAYGARAGIMALSREVPDIVFMDINMPGVDGFEVLAYIRRLPNLADVPVVFITSDDQPETHDRVKEIGALHLIVKPITMGDLENALKRANISEG